MVIIYRELKLYKIEDIMLMKEAKYLLEELRVN